jgi:D-beta-D-heptose 7-phosphate kinase/D-beta-D-heptose 1-phosphate adenosyltransferase
MLRADLEHVGPCDDALLLEALDRQLPRADAVVLSDYAKGVLTPTFLRAAIERIRARGIPIVTDPKSSDLSRYNGVTLLTPNISEAVAAVGMACGEDDEVAVAAIRILNTVPDTAAVLITRSAKGMTLVERGRGPHHLQALAREVFDVSGAGDTVIATVTLAIAAGASLAEATELSNLSAGIAVGKPGTAVVTVDDMQLEIRYRGERSADRKIMSLSEAADQVNRWRSDGERIGFTNGCFDLIHPGHVSQLAQARAQCGRLIVGLNADQSIQRLKGPDRPIQSEIARSIVLAALESVDLVILFEDDTPLSLIETLRPDVLIKGKDYRIDQVVGADIVTSYGGEVFLADIIEGHSTTNIISRLLTKVA